MVVLVSFHQVPLLIFNDLVQTHLTVGWKASELSEESKPIPAGFMEIGVWVGLDKIPTSVLLGRESQEDSALIPLPASAGRKSRSRNGGGLTRSVLDLAEMQVSWS